MLKDFPRFFLFAWTLLLNVRLHLVDEPPGVESEFITIVRDNSHEISKTPLEIRYKSWIHFEISSQTSEIPSSSRIRIRVIMLKFAVILALASVCCAQKSDDFAGALEIRSPLEVEVAAPESAILTTDLGSELMEFPAPALGVSAPMVHLPKGAQEVVDVPHAGIALPGNSLQNKDLNLNLPSPVVEAPKPIIREKEVLFRLPQPVFYVPKPIIQHKPIVHKVPHTLRTISPKLNIKEYLFKVPSAEITGKSGYVQPMPDLL